MPRRPFPRGSGSPGARKGSARVVGPGLMDSRDKDIEGRALEGACDRECGNPAKRLMDPLLESRRQPNMGLSGQGPEVLNSPCASSREPEAQKALERMRSLRTLSFSFCAFLLMYFLQNSGSILVMVVTGTS